MSEQYKLKYEVISILKANIQKGLESFGLTVAQSPDEDGWLVMESDQPSFRNADNVVLFQLTKTERIGWQSSRELYNSTSEKYDVLDYFIEQQIWNIKVLCKRTTEVVTDDNIPLTSEDVTSMLVAWFNRLGCVEFRKHNMANLFIQAKDVKTFSGKSEVPQMTTEFPLKIQVVKQFATEIDTATAEMGGVVAIEGKGEDDVLQRGMRPLKMMKSIATKIRGVFTDRH